MGFLSPGGGAIAVKAAPPPIETTPTPIARLTTEKDGLFHVTAYVNEAPIHFIVDTGANVTVMTPKDAGRAGVAAGPATARLETAAGRSAMRWARLDDIRIADRRFADARVAIVQTSMKHSLLGQDILSRFNSLTVRGRQLELR